MRIAIPVIGFLVTGRFGAYNYLILSTENFTPAETLSAELLEAGFSQAGFERIMVGSAAIHWAEKGG
jgi:ubiquinone/menaquinone biosynthesis C-methylase UbiE